MTNRDRVLAFLRSIAPADASNAEIVARTGIKPHQQIFSITRDLMHAGEIRGLRAGRDWRFYCGPARSQIRTTARRTDKSNLPEQANTSKPGEGRLSHRELADCERILKKIEALRVFLSENSLVDPMVELKWLTYLIQLREVLGNISNDIGFLATLLVKKYLERRFGIRNFDASAKPQGAAGIDIEATADDGTTIAGELKTTKPVQPGFGAQQRTMILKDLARLSTSSADYRFMFVTDPETYRTLSGRSFAARAPGVELVNLVTGETFTFPAA
jgi:hypothetical protein